MSALDNVVKISVLLASLTVIGDGALDTVRAIANQPKSGDGILTFQASTSAERAEITLTNLRPYTAYACVQGRIAGKAGAKAETVVICTGDMKPHSSVHITAPYKVGAVLDICNKQTAVGKVLDWTDCEFTVIDKTAMAERLPPAEVWTLADGLLQHGPDEVRAGHLAQRATGVHLVDPDIKTVEDAARHSEVEGDEFVGVCRGRLLGGHGHGTIA